MELWFSVVGFLVVIAIIVSIMTKKLSTMVALSVIPLIGAILVGQFASIPAFHSGRQQGGCQRRYVLLCNPILWHHDDRRRL